MEKRKPNTKCSECDAPIYRRPSEIEKSKSGKVFCSQGCYGKSIRRPIPCKACGKEILSTYNKKTCSTACSNINRKGIKYSKGSKKPIKNVTEITDGRALRRWLLKNRSYKCESCGYDNINVLHVHHIDGRQGKLFNDPDNLNLLCPNCHLTKHRGYKKYVEE